ncbi:hypothetical protein OG500_27580 [Kitasatospora sp. NBC_01250]|uniref:hypothetical protein n=1 Tax=unclassified Kitasatospora TaxID=2633591 RepID=UPI002E0E263A|nr:MULTISPECIES: hypothetical protein [unclassified Kitasatospora]WSJ69856.1 hypothetical protein OG294_29240 [Kitasatospora sp. NBC_01302]
MLASHSPVQARRVRQGEADGLLGEADTDTLDELVDSSRRLGAFWPLLAGGEEPGGAPGGPITVPARTRALVAGMAEYGV